MRIHDRIAIAAFGLALGVLPAAAFDGAPKPPADVTVVPPGQAKKATVPAPAMRRAVEADIPRPPGAIPSAPSRSLAAPVAMPNALPRPNPAVPAPSLARPAPIEQPNVPAFAAPSVPITPFEAFRSGTRQLRDGQNQQAVVSLEYAAEQGVIPAQWKLARMYAEGNGVDQSDLKAFEYFSRIADTHADDNPGTPQARFVANAFVALGHYYREGINGTEIKADRRRAQQMYSYAASYFGDPDGQYHLGRMLLDGNHKNPLQAARWLHAASNKGQYHAQAVLGRLLFQGETGLPRQPARGLMWLALARDNANPGEAWIADLYESAFSQASDDERALAGDYLVQWVKGKRD